MAIEGWATMTVPDTAEVGNLTAVPALPDPSEDAADAERRRAQVNRLGATDPQKTAELLRGLMSERQPV